MASAFGHGIAALALGAAFPRERKPFRLWLLLVIAAILPDVDSVGYRLGIPYGHPLGHRGFTHSILFAVLLALGISTLAFRRSRILHGDRWRLVAVFFLATASHGLLDAMTNGGLGIGFLVPFSNERYFLPWRPIEVSPLSLRRFFTAKGMSVLLSEARYIGSPCLLLAGLSRFWTGPRERK